MRIYPEIKECPEVYPPREDSYLLFDSVSIGRGEKVLDIGTGTGILAIGAALAGGEVFATDISERALECATYNSRRNSADIEFIRSDIFSSVRGRFHVILFNPPYLPRSNADYGSIKGALESGDGGSEHIRRFLRALKGHLEDGGRAYVLLSSHTRMNPAEFRDYGLRFREIAHKKLFFESIHSFMLF